MGDIGDAQAVRVGPAGWSYADWKGLVYPSQLPRGGHALESISRWFDTVEINVSFYRPLPPSHARAWVGRVAGNPRFRFTAKLWQRFTHEPEGAASEEDVALYLRGIEPLLEAGALGAVLMQFPWSFRRNPENRRRLAALISTFKALPLAVEVRHDSWMCAEFFESLSAHGVAYCNLDQPMLAGCIGPSEQVSSPVGYTRLHGRNAAAWFANNVPSYERYNYLYSAEELEPWVARIRSIGARADSSYAITNNHFEGKAVVNAFEILARLGRRPREIPEELLRRYPWLGEVIEAGPARAENSSR
jgi:uncharacterized protein YecE (DUF72 family)